MTDSKENLRAEYIKLAKRANARLRKLEVISHEKGFKQAKQWAYAKALRDIQKQGGKKRFKETVPENINMETLSSMRNTVYDFLSSPSSTKRGIIGIYKEKVDTFNREYNLNWDYKDMIQYFEQGGKELFEEQFSSKTALDVLAVVRKNPKEIKKLVDDYNKNHVVNDKIIDRLKSNKDDRGNPVIDWKTKERLMEILTDKKFKLKDFY